MDRSNITTLAFLIAGMFGLELLRRLYRNRDERHESATIAERREKLEQLLHTEAKKPR